MSDIERTREALRFVRFGIQPDHVIYTARVSDAELAELGYVKKGDRWRYCPMCGRLNPRLSDLVDNEPSALCLPTNCDGWVHAEVASP